MATTLLTDPLRFLRETVNKLEGELNTLANSKMDSPEFSSLLHRYVQASIVLQQLFGKALAGTYKRLNLPSRSDIVALTATLQRIEDKLDRVLGCAPPSGLQPARTRRPPEEAPNPVPAAPKRTRKAVRAGS